MHSLVVYKLRTPSILVVCISDIQCGCRGLMPSRTVTITDENGKPYRRSLGFGIL